MPAAMPLAIPVAVMVAIVVLLLLQTPPDGLQDKVTVLPVVTEVAPVIEAGAVAIVWARVL